MIKYPELLTPKKFAEILRSVPEILDYDAIVQPKYDGSNITCFHETCLTRNLNQLPENFAAGLRQALGNKYRDLMRLSTRYQIFLELGGYRNSPAGYSDAWDGDWDYRIFDLFVGQFLPPEKVEKIVNTHGLKYVGYRTMPVCRIVDEWRRLLSAEYSSYEGFVIKIFIPNEVKRKIRHHKQYNTILIKFKHEYLGHGHTRKSSKKIKKKREEIIDSEKPELEESEILGAINKVHLQLGDEIFNKKKAMPLIFKLVKEEAKKHDRKVPKASTIYKYYMLYIKRIQK